MKRYWKIAVLANIKDDTSPKPDGVPPDAFADYDHIETIDAIRAALETDGHKTIFLQADRDLPFTLRDAQPDICFNIAEGLGGDDIPIPARLMAVADVYDALVSRRVYKAGIPHEEALLLLAEGKGTHFDPDVVDAFLEIGDDVRRIAALFRDTDEELAEKAASLERLAREASAPPNPAGASRRKLRM